MNILLLSPRLPWPPFDGARIRIFETLRYLSRGNRVTLLAPVRNPEEVQDASALTGFCERIVTTVPSKRRLPILRRLAKGLLKWTPLVQSFHYDEALAGKVCDLTFRYPYDIIHVEFPFMAPYIGSVSSASPAKRVLSMHNIESIRFERELRFSAWDARRLVLLSNHLLFKSWEEASLRGFDGVVVVSRVEQAWVRRHAPTARVELAPNGVDTDYFVPLEPPPSGGFVVFTGLMNYLPNVDAVAWFCDEILPIVQRRHPDVRLRIVGDRPDRRVLALGRRPGVHVTGRVPDIRPYFKDCLAFIAPLRSGGGTRLKILQAMAMARPVVSTSLGAEGLEVAQGVNILMGDTPQEFADHLVTLLANPQLRERLGTAGRRLVEAEYDWRICLRNLDAFYQSLLASAPVDCAPADRDTRQTSAFLSQRRPKTRLPPVSNL